MAHYSRKTNHKGWTSMVIQDVECWIPPVGFVYNWLTNTLDEVEVLERKDKEGDFVYQPDALPDDYYHRRSAEWEIQQSDPKYIDPELEKMRSLFWHRRLFGIWIMIGPKENPTPTYLTGLHYFYTSWWTIDIGRPSYRDNDRLYAYFINQGKEDPRCRGSIKITKRRGGKTFFLGCFIYEEVSRRKKARGGIQSKTEKDAQEVVYTKALREPFEELPDFFQPEKINQRILAKRMEFSEYETRKKNQARRFGKKASGLQSLIDAKSAKETAYDGTKMHAYGSDEASKLEEADIFERHMVIRFCLEEEEQIIGYAMYTTTVEDMKGRNESFRKLWNRSDPNKRDANGETRTGMYRYFEPAYKVLFFDKYGKADEAKATQRILNTAKALESDRKEYISYVKKNPLKIEHAFMIDDGNSPFDQLKLNERLDVLEWEDDGKFSDTYRLDWTNGPYSSVKYTKDPNGVFVISQLPPDDLANNVDTSTPSPEPKNLDYFTAGLDMYKFKEVVDGKGSMAGLVIKKRLWSDQPTTSNKPALVYLHRPATKEKCYDDIMKALWLYGTDVLPERNAGNFPDWIEDNGLEKFMVYIEGKPGIYATEKTNAQLTEYLEDYIFHNSENIDFEVLITQGIDFDPANTQKYDAIMAWGYAETLDRIRRSVKRRENASTNTVSGSAIMKVLSMHPVSAR